MSYCGPIVICNWDHNKRKLKMLIKILFNRKKTILETNPNPNPNNLYLNPNPNPNPSPNPNPNLKP